MRIDGLWWTAQLAGFCGLFSIAAGVMSAAMMMAFAIFEIARGRRDAWAWCTVGVNLALLGYGWWLLPVQVASSGHGFEHLCQTLIRAGYLLLWPFQSGGWGLLFQAPCVGAVVWSLPQRGNQCPARMVALLWLWIFLVASAIAYGRIITPETIGVRYFDVLLVGIFANGLALLRLLAGPERRFTRWKIGFALVWLIAVGAAFWEVNNPLHSGAMLRQQKEYALEQKNVVRGFLSSETWLHCRNLIVGRTGFPTSILR
jgi:hypothetical protein